MTLLQQFVDSELIRGLTTGDKAQASLYITIMGMSITFIALTVLWGCISILSVIFKPGKKKEKVFSGIAAQPEVIQPATMGNNGGEREIIAVITAAVAAVLDAPLSSFRVTSIIRTEDQTPQWGQVGRIEQLTRTIQRN